MERAQDQAAHCDGTTVPAGFEGMHIFDISNLANPELVGEVELSARPQARLAGVRDAHADARCGSREQPRGHLQRDLGREHAAATRGPECDWIDIVQVPLTIRGAASHVRREPLMGGHAAHDNGVILGDVNKLAVASGHMSNVFDIGANDTPGGSLADPAHLFTIEEAGVWERAIRVCTGNWHSAAFSWDGEVDHHGLGAGRRQPARVRGDRSAE